MNDLLIGLIVLILVHRIISKKAEPVDVSPKSYSRSSPLRNNVFNLEKIKGKSNREEKIERGIDRFNMYNKEDPIKVSSDPPSQDLYLSPWRNLDEGVRIFDLDGDGDLQEQRDAYGILSGDNFKRMRNSNLLLETILNFLKDIVTGKRPKNSRMRIFCNCFEKSFCTFLTCPNLKHNCVLCEFRNINGNKRKNCKYVSTRFLKGFEK